MFCLSSCPPSIALLLLFLIVRSVAGVLLSSLPQTLVVSISVEQGQVLRAGEDTLMVSWGLNQSFPVWIDQAYKTVKVALCYAPASQASREWRKTNDDLGKDKACQFGITMQPYRKANSSTSFEYTLSQDVPSATYFVRAYALSSDGMEVAYGQTTDGNKSNLFHVVGVSSRGPWMDTAAWFFSGFSIMALIVLAVVEKRKVKS